MSKRKKTSSSSPPYSPSQKSDISDLTEFSEGFIDNMMTDKLEDTPPVSPRDWSREESKMSGKEMIQEDEKLKDIIGEENTHNVGQNTHNVGQTYKNWGDLLRKDYQSRKKSKKGGRRKKSRKNKTKNYKRK